SKSWQGVCASVPEHTASGAAGSAEATHAAEGRHRAIPCGYFEERRLLRTDFQILERDGHAALVAPAFHDRVHLHHDSVFREPHEAAGAAVLHDELVLRGGLAFDGFAADLGDAHLVCR